VSRGGGERGWSMERGYGGGGGGGSDGSDGGGGTRWDRAERDDS